MKYEPEIKRFYNIDMFSVEIVTTEFSVQSLLLQIKPIYFVQYLIIRLVVMSYVFLITRHHIRWVLSSD